MLKEQEIGVFFNRPGQPLPIDSVLEDMHYAADRLAIASAWFTYTPIAEAFLRSGARHKACFLNRADLPREGGRAWQAIRHYFALDYFAEREQELIGWEGCHILGAAQWQHGVMHHKFLVVDDLVVWCGSLNFTYQALNNYEALLRIPSSQVCNQFWDEITRLAFLAINTPSGQLAEDI